MNTDSIFDYGEGGMAGIVIGFEDRFDVFCRLIHVIVHHGFDDLRDFSQANAFV